MNVEHSQTSKSSSSRISVSDVTVHRRSILESFFPLFDQMSQKAELPSSCYYLPIVWVAFQVVITSLWQGHNNMIGNADPATKIIQWIIIIFSMKPDEASQTNDLIRFGVYIGLLAIIIGIMIYQQIYFSKMRRFTKAVLYPCRVILEIIPMVMVTPTASFVGYLFLKLFDNVNTVNVVMFAFMVIAYIGFLFFFIFVMNLFGISPFLATKMIADYDIGPIVLLITINSIFQLVSIILEHFPEWILHPVVLIHMATILYIYFDFYNRPFILFSMNSTCNVVLTLCILMDIIRVVGFCFDSFDTNLYAILVLVSIVIALIINIIIFALQDYNLKRMFNFENLDKLDDNEKIDLFRQLKIDISPRKANLILHYSVENYLPFLTDFSIIKFLFEHYSNNSKIKSQLIRIVAFFPGETRLLNIFYNEYIKKKSLLLKERFLRM